MSRVRGSLTREGLIELAALVQLCPKLPLLPSAPCASSSGAADAEQTHPQALIATDEVSGILDCSLGSQAWDSCGWSLLTWHSTVKSSALSALGGGISNASADEEMSLVRK